MDAESTPLLTVTEAASLLNVSKATIRRWTDEGTLACLRIGVRKERRFRRSDLMAMLDAAPNPMSVASSLFAATESPVSSGSCSGHQCIVSNSADEEWAALGPAILAALREGASVLMVEANDRRAHLERLLDEQGWSLPELLESQRLRCVSIEESYYLSGEFRWDRAIAFVESVILEAKARGFERVLVIGANAGRAESDAAVYAQEMKKYELGLDEMLSRHPGATALCPYNANEISAQLMVQGFLTHPHVQVNDTPLPGYLGKVAV